MKFPGLALACFACSALGCAPELDDRPYLIQGARLIAVLAEPAEARPRDIVTLSPVVAGRSASELSFHFCAKKRPLSDPRPIAEACLDEPAVTLEPYGSGARGAIPADACARFGPDPSGGNLRPMDADATGGFYQPVVVAGLGQPAVTLLRIHCPLPDAPADLARALEQTYALNRNPELSGLEARVDGAPQNDFTLQAGVPTTLRASWPVSSREQYWWLPPDGNAIAPRREALRVGWFASSGVLAASATGGDSADESSSSSNTFIADPGTASVELWVVLQDSRGGSAAQRWRVPVSP